MDGNKKRKIRTLLIYLLAFALVIGAGFYLITSSTQGERVQYYEIVSKFEQGKVTVVATFGDASVFYFGKNFAAVFGLVRAFAVFASSQ